MKELKKFGASELLRFAGPSARAVFDEADELVQAVHANRPPKWPSGNRECLNKLKGAMGLFYKVDSPDGKVVLYGRLALEQQYATVDQMKTGGNGCKYSDMTPLMVYSWFLKAEHQKKVVEWSQQVLAAVGKAKMSGKAPNSSAKSSSSRESSQRADPGGPPQGSFRLVGLGGGAGSFRIACRAVPSLSAVGRSPAGRSWHVVPLANADRRTAMGPTTVELGIATLARMRWGSAPTGRIVRCMLGEASHLAHIAGRCSFELRHSHAHGAGELPITPDVASAGLSWSFRARRGAERLDFMIGFGTCSGSCAREVPLKPDSLRIGLTRVMGW